MQSAAVNATVTTRLRCRHYSRTRTASLTREQPASDYHLKGIRVCKENLKCTQRGEAASGRALEEDVGGVLEGRAAARG